MIHLILPAGDRYTYQSPVTLLTGEVNNYDFSKSIEQILRILRLLENCGLILECPYESSEEVLHNIQMLIDDIDLGSDEVQISEHKHIRIEYRDEMLSLEVYLGV